MSETQQASERPRRIRHYQEPDPLDQLALRDDPNIDEDLLSMGLAELRARVEAAQEKRKLVEELEAAKVLDTEEIRAGLILHERRISELSQIITEYAEGMAAVSSELCVGSDTLEAAVKKVLHLVPDEDKRAITNAQRRLKQNIKANDELTGVSKNKIQPAFNSWRQKSNLFFGLLKETIGPVAKN